MCRPPKVAISAIAAPSCPGSSGANSSTPEGSRKHLKPTTPASCSGRRSATLPGTAPPQNATSTASWPAAHARFTFSAATSTVGGMLFSGMSTMVVIPPAAAAAVAGAKPSHSVRPGSFPWASASTSPRGGRGGEPLPLGAAGLVHMDMAVHQPREQDAVVWDLDGARRGRDVIDNADHCPLADEDGCRALASRRYDAACPDCRRLTHLHPPFPGEELDLPTRGFQRVSPRGGAALKVDRDDRDQADPGS